MFSRLIGRWILGFAILSTYRCSQCQKPQNSAPAAAPSTREILSERGRKVFSAQCTACHARNPAQDGALGPALTGSSRELLEARVLHGNYPPGYVPKRKSGVMVALPHLKDEIEALHAFLNP